MDKLTKLVNDWDPGGFMHHAPDDEYQFEVDELKKYLKDQKQHEKFSLLLFKLFQSSLGDDRFKYSKDECKEFALTLIDAYITDLPN